MNSPSRNPPGRRALSSDEQAALREELSQLVQTSHLFKSLDERGRGRVLDSGYLVTFAAGTPIMQQDAPGDTMYLILQGTVRVETQGPNGSVELAQLGRGACIGEVSVLSGGTRTATVTAVDDVNAVAFERERIEKVLEDYPRVRKLLESLVEGRARDTIEKTVGH